MYSFIVVGFHDGGMVDEMVLPRSSDSFQMAEMQAVDMLISLCYCPCLSVLFMYSMRLAKSTAADPLKG